MLFQDESVAVSSPVQEVFLDQGLGLALCFFQSLYSESRSLSNIPRISFSLLRMNVQSFKFWKLEVSQVTDISLETKKILTKDLLDCIIAFSKLAKEEYFNLSAMTSLLEGIKEKPDEYPVESRLWEYIINNSHYARTIFSRKIFNS